MLGFYRIIANLQQNNKIFNFLTKLILIIISSINLVLLATPYDQADTTSSSTTNLVARSFDNHKYQLELILFNNINHLVMAKPENFNSMLGLNSPVGLDFTKYLVPMKFLLPSYEKLVKQSNYQIIFRGATRYELLGLQKNKKFFIKIDLDPAKFAYDQTMQGTFIINLVINHYGKNMFNIKFDGGIGKVRLTKFARIKSKELYYFDHPKFGALITLSEVKS